MADNDEEETLVHRRSRRSTAGNRMEAALAEMSVSNPDPELETDDDKDFEGPADEDEVFDSDFQSTDEEADQDNEAAAEKAIIAEEKQERRTARQRTVRIVESLTSGPAQKNVASTSSRAKLKPKKAVRRASLRGSTEGKIGEAVSKRKSRRQSTVLSSQILNSRLKDEEERRALQPKRIKEASVKLTQAELLARALDTEEGNIASHRDYLTQEEEKRRRVRVVRQSTRGPVIRWVSRAEEEKVTPKSPPPMASLLPSNAYGGYGAQLGASTTIPSTSVYNYQTYQPYGAAPLPSSYFAPSLAMQALPYSQPQTQLPTPRMEKVSRSYLIHELDQTEFVAKPDWGSTMKAIFGSHVNWEEVEVFSGKHRPLSRPVMRCPLTGRVAPYRDPRSGVPFANVDAFKTLTHILAHEYIWNDELRCYTASEKAAQIETEAGEAAPPAN